METRGSTIDSWWQLDNTLLSHGINFEGDTLGNYIKDVENPIPKVGEIACSIISPVSQRAYARQGLILSSVKPNKVSYKDVGSYFPKGTILKRESKGKIWNSDSLSQTELMFLSCLNGSYNEVFVSSEKTAIIGIYSDEKNVSEYLERIIRVMTNDDAEPIYLERSKTIGYAILESDFYVAKMCDIDNISYKWRMSDAISYFVTRQGYNLRKIGEHDRLADDLAKNLVSLDDILPEPAQNIIFGYEFEKQPIPKSYKNKIRDILESFN